MRLCPRTAPGCRVGEREKMLESYDDIRRRIPEPPKWFDTHGVPRYDDFHPSLSPNVYAKEVMLYEIACQNCNARFLVEENWSMIEHTKRSSLSERVAGKRIHYGDPPCWECAVGATLNCEDIQTIQFWVRKGMDWERKPELEGIPLE